MKGTTGDMVLQWTCSLQYPLQGTGLPELFQQLHPCARGWCHSAGRPGSAYPLAELYVFTGHLEDKIGTLPNHPFKGAMR
jgi:hypothetical protein